ncbi:MAG TPA: DUF2877 domain-containing protein [Pseudolabrys sp.]|nr:DUF2877 domain-containing protein [Pseudolabrys sp.]
MLKPETEVRHGETMRVAVLGEFAQAILHAHPGGTVIAVFRRSFYVQFGRDVVCVGPPGLGKGPLNVLAVVPVDLEWPAFGVTRQQDVSRSGPMLRVGEHLVFDLNGAELWRPPPLRQFSRPDLQKGLRLLAEAAQRRVPGGLGALLTTLDKPSLPPVSKDDALLQAALWPIATACQWLGAALAGSPEPPPPAEGLIALGPGLTPSCDDFLCGVMAALNYLGHRDVAARLAASVLPVAERETSLISAAYLRCAAKGHASAVLYDALDSVLHGGRELEARLDAVHAVGHTSGWDSLVGAASVCAALTQQTATTG